MTKNKPTKIKDTGINFKKKEISSMLNGKDMINHSIVGLIQRCWMKFSCIKMSQYFPKPFKLFGGDINVKVNLSNYRKWYI